MKTRQKRRKNAQEDNIRISVKKVVQWGGMGLVVDALGFIMASREDSLPRGGG